MGDLHSITGLIGVVLDLYGNSFFTCFYVPPLSETFRYNAICKIEKPRANKFANDNTTSVVFILLNLQMNLL
jgi:hypothetical protein